jgi:hypothetical protein
MFQPRSVTRRFRRVALAIAEDGTRLWEVGWESSASRLVVQTGDAGFTWAWAPPRFTVGAGGGASVLYEQPTWQQGVVPDALATAPGAAARVIPDVAALADPTTGFLIREPSTALKNRVALKTVSLLPP